MAVPQREVNCWGWQKEARKPENARKSEGDHDPVRFQVMLLTL
ncbi:hypothetical protein [Pseudescherichia sp.]|nr:hypothetical protein [Pseudescherichia sp.]